MDFHSCIICETVKLVANAPGFNSEGIEPSVSDATVIVDGVTGELIAYTDVDPNLKIRRASGMLRANYAQSWGTQVHRGRAWFARAFRKYHRSTRRISPSRDRVSMKV